MPAAKSYSTRALAAAIAAGALVAGCGDDDEKSTAAAKPAAFAIEATAEGKKKKALKFPATVKAGIVTLTLTNSDTVPRSAGIARLVGDHTVDDFLKVVNSESEGDAPPIPDWIQDGGGISTVKPGETATVTQVLAPGRYAIADDEGDGEGPSPSELGAKGEFTVTGEASDAELPAQPASVSPTDEGEGDDKEYSFELQGLKAGANQVRFENTGEELHHALFFPMRDGVTIADVEKAFASDGPPKGPPPVDFEKGVGTTVIDGGIAQNITLDLPAARYAVICFISDREGGKPHVAKGMIEELAVE